MAKTVISPVNVEERGALDLRAGDTVRVHQKITDKGKTRIQIFEGTVLARKHGSEPGATFTVRRTTGGYGVEKIFPLYSPMVDKIEIIRRAKVRRAKLYYIREKAAREIKRQMRRITAMYSSTEGELERANREAQEVENAEAAKAAEQAKLDEALQNEAAPADDSADSPEPEVAESDTTDEAAETPVEETAEEPVETQEEAKTEE